MSFISQESPPNTISKRRRAKTQTSKPATSSSSSLLMEPPSGLFPSKPELLRLFAVVTIAASVAVSSNYLATFINPTPKPYCDTEFYFSPSSPVKILETFVNPAHRSLASSKIQNQLGLINSCNINGFASWNQDSCEPCPSYGECQQGKLECARGYRKVGKLCVEDGDIIETAKKLSELVERRVCEAYAHYLCEGAGAAWTQEGKLWHDLDESILKENSGLNSDVYEYAKQKAVETTSKLLESRTSDEGIKELGCPQLLIESYMPLNCCVRQWIVKHAMVLVPLCSLLIGSLWIIFRLRQRFYQSSRAEQLYSQVCDILEEHALISRSPNSVDEPWVIASWLRDHLLLPRERKDPMLWKKVEELVQEDSRLDRYPKIVKGESKVVWEWQVEGSLSSARKRKKTEGSNLKASEGIIPISKQNYLVSKGRELLKS